ncbi:restriction endonuclease subunit S [Acinetobacter baumannii]|uniref:restriction endonuclease subunit S n=1 Tax=Acinetobacter baumannii TaxID=470 RepID=UPI0002CFC556|nr:restriction endonuclease subunit S [Acinetobacter baumannii]ENW32504.1 hypothetical protein F922_03813 [Acinetobacter baumannii NIPH 201]MDA3469763.1 restriction endonuclease subunit S [Acinetobacter baumannii]MDA3475927.1 restriction endonuclease subunit S [Acinetobacter baumannii]MDC4594860.1 restriction endonuclease subunit S [Acinetobacter baumannii]MDC5068240.1 restriction endonuclease subunit S [Acinetobacter baumannii]
MSQFELSEVWETSELASIVNFIDYRGKTPTKTSEGIPLITAKNIRDGYINREPREFIAEDAYDSWMTRGFPQLGDLVITTEAPMGNVAVLDIQEKFALAQRAICLSFVEEPRLSKFIYYYLRSQSFKSALVEKATGTTVQGIKAAELKKIPVPIAPLAEQKIIADKLDTLLAQVESIKARLERIPEILKQFRQSVLAAAVSGKLTEEWRIGAEVGLGSTVPIKDVAELNPKKPKIEDTIEVGFSPMTMASEGVSSDLGFEVRTWAEVKKGFTVFQNEDVLLAKITPCFENGKSAIPQNLPNGYGAGSTEFMVLRCSKNQILPKYLYFNLGTTSFLVQGEVNMTGSVGHKRVPKEFVGDWQIYLPTLSEQIEIIRKVELNFASAQSIEQLVQSALDRVSNLTQSILAKAFRGELTADWREANPELISGENSAEALLKRIKAERESAKPTTKRGRAKT